jgi:hypothetical protein
MAKVRLEGLDQLKNLMPSLQIEPVAFRLVAQCLNQLRYRSNHSIYCLIGRLVVQGALSPEARRPGRDHSPPSSAEVRNVWSYTSTPTYVFMTWWLIRHKDSFLTFTFVS